MAENKETHPLGVVMKHLRAIEQTMLDLDMNERINLLSYAIAGYVVAMAPAGEREATAKAVGRAITFVCLPVMTQISAKAGTDHETLTRRQS